VAIRPFSPSNTRDNPSNSMVLGVCVAGSRYVTIVLLVPKSIAIVLMKPDVVGDIVIESGYS
jgi:hypothetical protein